tara:strand:- start:656 stop:763 length:108 start_codon:yes stop_codon:yes gene_type:complete
MKQIEKVTMACTVMRKTREKQNNCGRKLTIVEMHS